MKNNRKYRHPYDEDTKAFISCSGNQFELDERLVIDDDGNWSIEQVGVIDQQALIDSHRSSVDLKTMIERFKSDGDISHFNRVSGGSFLDLSGAPQSLAEYYQIVENANEEFMSQPLSVRERFGHNPVLYFKDVAAKRVAGAAAVAQPEQKVEVPTE